MRRWRLYAPLAVCVVCFAIAGWQITSKYRDGYRLVQIDAEESWRVTLRMDVTAHDKDIAIRAMVPERSTPRQELLSVDFVEPGFERTREGDYWLWQRQDLTGDARILVTMRVRTEARSVDLPGVLEWEDLPSAGLEEYLAPESGIQSEHGDIRAQAELLADSTDDVIEFVHALFAYVDEKIVYRTVGGPTDAVTAYLLGEASCNGKNRLFVALARARGVPARFAKGLILEQGAVKTTSHSWSELFLDGQWVPFCPTGHYFARLPEQYFEFPKKDSRLFRYTKGVRFSHEFGMTKGVRTVDEALRTNLDRTDHPLRFCRCRMPSIHWTCFSSCLRFPSG
jgi:transglutaminase-like putative cysteine protease